MSTIWILILFFGNDAGVTAAEFSNETSCRAAIVSASLTVTRVKAVCVAKEIK